MGVRLSVEKSASLAGKSGLRLPHFEISAVWIRFVISIAGLCLAFVAALFSTVSRESGNMPATLIFASIALIMAVVIGLTTVPYLAKRVAARRIRNAVDYKVTKFGVVYATLVLMIGIAALNTGNNLLYIVVAAMLAAILVSGVVSAIVLRDLELEVRMPAHVFAGEPFRARFILRNPRRWLACFSTSVVPSGKDKEIKHWRWEATTFSFPPRRPQAKQWLKLPDRKLQRVAQAVKGSCILAGSTYFPYIPAGERRKADLDLSFTRRGRYKEGNFALASGFPFSFLIKTRQVAPEREVVVYPSVQGPPDCGALLSAISGEQEAFTRGCGDDLYRLREYVPDDSARHVDWKATAKTGSLKVREFSRTENRRVRIVFDNPARGSLSAKKYEEAVATVASLSWRLAAENVEISYVSQHYECCADAHSFLKFLSTVSPTTAPSLLESLNISGEYNVIVTTHHNPESLVHLRGCSYFVVTGAG